MSSLTVTYFQRQPFPEQKSMEIIFDLIRKNLPKDIESKVVLSRFYSKGFLPRILNLIHAWWNKGDLNHLTGDVNYLMLALPSKNTILTIHDCHMYKKKKGLRRLLLFLFWLKIPVWKAKVITTISEDSKKDIINITNCDPKKIQVIGNPLNPIFTYFPKKFNEENPKILLVGTMPHKNLDRLVKAIKGTPCCLEIIGPLNKNQIELLKEYKIDYHNSFNLTNEEVLQKYIDCDIIFCASLHEGFGMSIIEGQAVGRVVITSNVAAMPEVGGRGCIYVNPYSIPHISKSLSKIIQSKKYRDTLILKARENVKRFDAINLTKQYLETYFSIGKN